MSFQPNNVKATSWMAKRYSIKNSKPSTSTIQSQAFKLLTARYSPPNEQYKSQYTGQSNVQYNAQHNSQFSTRHFINEPHKDDVVATTTAAKKPSQKVHINTKKVVTSTTSEYASTTEYEKRRRCQAKVSTEFYPSATTCENDRSDRICAYLFDEPDPITGQRDPKCNLAGMEDIADSCRKQCAICCEKIEYACEDDHNDIISCSKQLDKCHVSKWFDVLTKFCAGSCGLCTRSECRDYDVNCREIKDQCLQSDKIDDMREKCARTCGFCVVGGQGINEMPLKKPPVPQCIDTAENCTKNEHLCASPLHAEFMIKYCAKTCFKCSVGPNVIVPVIGTPHDINGTAAVLMPASVIMEAAVHNSKICEDRHPKCAIWVSKGFCTHEKYTLQQRQALCPKSCKLC
ncbi:unnamed protein product [Bursaphelenchus okinawaensis]|uniref:ShKT domain-containing protein n=1 Tax=Bursaphelenchus okinawaensis TaxID=465554 RepID=A0A811L781_9BILA|nr:unnamed protein product [Bursaphelenchus okinawaensis]CAG9118210.1 unnamed protein product [Bursaphelenchus okinawaensis]